jgi:hypothetical protein
VSLEETSKQSSIKALIKGSNLTMHEEFGYAQYHIKGSEVDRLYQGRTPSKLLTESLKHNKMIQIEPDIMRLSSDLSL